MAAHCPLPGPPAISSCFECHPTFQSLYMCLLHEHVRSWIYLFVCVSVSACTSTHLWKTGDNFGYCCTLCETVFCCSLLHTPGNSPTLPSIFLQACRHCRLLLHGSRNPNSSPLCHFPSPGPTSLRHPAECPGDQCPGKHFPSSDSCLDFCPIQIKLQDHLLHPPFPSQPRTTPTGRPWLDQRSTRFPRSF